MVYSKLMTYEDSRIMPSGDRLGHTISKIVIHHNATTDPEIALNTWANGETSAHYEITDTKIIGCIPEELAAWHAGDRIMNYKSIGLEHVNSTLGPTWSVSEATLNNSAKLIVDICSRYNLPINNTTIIPHNNIVPTICPGGINVDKLIKKAIQLKNSNKSNQNPNIESVKDMLKLFKVSVGQESLRIMNTNSGKTQALNGDQAKTIRKFLNNNEPKLTEQEFKIITDIINKIK